MKKIFTLRIDLESNKGIKKGLPKLLDLLKKYNIKASFYLVMGGESNIFELLKYRKKLKNSGERVLKLWRLKEKLRMAFFPKDFVVLNKKNLRRIIEEGHELGLHDWKHKAWARGLDKINIKEHIIKSKRKYEKIFQQNPISFSAPGFNINEKILGILEENNIQFISDFPGESPKFYGKIKNVPMTILGKNKMPIIEYFVSKGKTDKEIFDYIKKEISKRKLISFYIHGLFEARFKIRLLEKIFKFINEEKIKVNRIIDY